MSSRSELIIHKAMRATAAMLGASRLTTVVGGLENIPAHGPVLIVSRHYHHLYDGLALFAALRRPFHIVVALDWVKNRRMRWLMEALNGIARWPVLLRRDALARAGNDASRIFSSREVAWFQRSALRAASDLLIDNRVVVIFAEGYPVIDPVYTTKTDPDQFLPFKPGFIHVVRVAERKLRRKIPIIPAGLRYSADKKWIGYLRFGEPVWREDFGRPAQLLEVIEDRVRQLSASP